MKTKFLISWLAMLALVSGAQRGVTAAGDSQKKKPPGQDTYTITQLDTGENVASSGQLISDNQVVAGNLQGDALFAFAWSAQTGFVVLTLGGSSSLVSGMSSNGIVTGAADTPGETEVIGFIWTPADGLVTIGNLGGSYTVPQGVNSSGVVIGDATTAEGRDHAFMWTEAGGMVDLDPTGLDDSAARFVTEDGGLIIGTISAETGQRVFAWTKTTGLTDIGTLGSDMLPEIMNRQGALTGRVLREDGTSGTFFWSQANGLEEIGSLGGDEMSPTAINDAGTIVGFGTTASGETHGFVWSQADGLVDIGTLGGDFSWASDINSSGLVAGYSKTADGDDHAVAWSADGGLIDLGTLGGSRSRGQFVTEAGAIIGISGAKGTGRTRSCGPRPAGWSKCRRSVGSRTWARRVGPGRSPASRSKRSRCTRCCGRRHPRLPSDSVSLSRRAGGPVMRTALVTASVLGLVLMAGIAARSDQASAQSRGHADFQGYWIGVDPVDGGDARRSLILRTDGKYALAARDSMLTLCDSTDRGFASFDDGTVVSRTVMQSNSLVIKCFNNHATVQLHLRFELVERGLMIETATLPDGSPVSTIVLHKVSTN